MVHFRDRRGYRNGADHSHVNRVYTTNVFVYILSEGKGASGAVVRRFFFGFDCSATLFLEERSSATN